MLLSSIMCLVDFIFMLLQFLLVRNTTSLWSHGLIYVILENSYFLIICRCPHSIVEYDANYCLNSWNTMTRNAKVCIFFGFTLANYSIILFLCVGCLGFIVMGQNRSVVGCLWWERSSRNMASHTWCSHSSFSSRRKTASLQYIGWANLFLGSSRWFADVYNRRF